MGAEEPETRSAGGLQSVQRALDVLACFRGGEELGLVQLAGELNLGKSTTHRLLTALRSRGFVEQNPETGRYRLGIAIHELGQLAVSRSRLRQFAMPLLEELRHRTGQTIHLAMADGATVLHIERLYSPQTFSYLKTAPLRLPTHVTSTGKVIAAFDNTVEAATLQAGFPAMTDYSIREAERFQHELVRIRKNGFAVNRNEAMLGLTSIAAPVLDLRGRPISAISICGPSDSATVNSTARLVAVTAQRLARIVTG